MSARALRVLVAVTVLLTAQLVFAAAQGAASEVEERVVTFDGAGWGHAVGMSQYGAQARALDGQDAEQILGSYYTESTVGTLGTGALTSVGDVHVNVDSDVTAKTVTVSELAGGPSGVEVVRGPDRMTLGAGDWFTVTDETPADDQPQGCRVNFSEGTEWTAGSCDLSANLTSGDTPEYLLSLDSCRRLAEDCRFALGTALLFVDNASPSRTRVDRCPQTLGPTCPGFDVVVQIDIDDYTRGIAEVPYSWDLEALKTQAIAARSYAASFAAGTKPNEVHEYQGCFCDVLNSSSDQVYAGWLDDEPTWEAWDAAALATAGQVVTHPAAVPGTIVRAFYSSSNGGASESSEDKWGGVHPYLVSVPDHWSLQPPNPFASWTETTPHDEFASWLGMVDVRDAEVVETNASGSPRTFRYGGFDADGNVVQATKAVWEIQQRYGLRSWFFSITIDQPPPPPPPKPDQGADRVALQDPRTGIWHLANSDGSVTSFYYGNPRDIPYAGDWDGDGVVTLGLYRQSTGFLFLRNANSQGIADIEIYYGDPGDIPIAGDWDGDGIDTVGIFRPSEARFYLRNTNTQGVGDLDVQFGDGGDFPVAGDWDGDGIDTVGVYRPSTKTLYLTNSLTDPAADITFAYTGAAGGDRILAGDWNDDGIDTIGLYRPSDRTFYLRDTFTQSSANIVIEMGDSWMNPVAGWWGD